MTEGGSSVGTRASTGSIEKQSNGDEKENLASLNAACMLPNDSSCIRENTSDVTETPTQKQSNGDEKEILVPHSTTCSLPTCSADKSGKTTDITETPTVTFKLSSFKEPLPLSHILRRSHNTCYGPSCTLQKIVRNVPGHTVRKKFWSGSFSYREDA
uniref:Uncharacterized protein n=1 Tax=Sphaerodactylus townsendi TaxID=933632 RepID=A0ACB8F074_9SAUR